MIAALIAVVIMASCATSNKLDYASAYKFGHYNYNKVAENQAVQVEDLNTAQAETQEMTEAQTPVEDVTLYASEEPVIDEDIKARLEQAEQKIYHKIGVTKEQADLMETEELVSMVKNMDRKDKRELRKELRSDIKALKKAKISNASSVNDSKETMREMGLTGYTRIGAILGGIGLILLLLGAVFSDILIFFGVAMILAGVVFIMIDLF